jgi:NAD(P)H-hydrate epimerase
VICGKGNNGGDGLVAARKLQQAGREVRLLLLADPSELHGDAAANFARLQKSLNSRESSPDKRDSGSLIIFNAWGEPAFREIFSCDGPTVIADIGTPAEAIESSLNLSVITPKDIAGLIGPRPRDSNKGMYGHVLVVGGSLGKSGAAAMAGFSALRSGAGLVTVATPESALGTVAAYRPELMTEPLSETDAGSIAIEALEKFNWLSENKTVLAVGPGISRHASTEEFVRAVVVKSQTPVVLDADGLNAFENRAHELNGRDRTLVLTPHPGEMARLTGLSIAAIQRDRINVARSFAGDHQLILVLKGDRTIVANPEGEAWVNTTGNPGMATGGTGDILTGIVAGMLAQNPKHAFLAVLAAVYLHGLAGDIAEESTGEQSLVATDLIKWLPEAFRRVRAQAAQKWAKIGDWRTPSRVSLGTALQ